jgi:tetratricopeptide (TPR) repeat protein
MKGNASMNRYLLVLLLLFGLTGTVLSQDKPRKPYQLYEDAEAAYNSGHLTSALAFLDECVKINAGYMEAYAFRATIREQLRDFDGALTDYSIYLDRYPDDPAVLLNRGVLRYKIGFYDQAKEDLRHLLQVPSAQTNALLFKPQMSVDDHKPIVSTADNGHDPYVYNYIGLVEYKSNNPRLAIAYFDSAIHLNRKEPDFYVNRGLAKEQLNDSTALTDYDMALSIQSDHALARHNIEAWQAKTSRKISAEQRLSNTIALDPTLIYPYLERAQDRYSNGDYKGANADYTRALEYDNDNVEIWIGRGLTREKLNDLEGAFSDYTKAIDLKEDYAKAWINRGNLLLKMNRFADAIEDYNVALIYYPDYGAAFYNRAMAKARLQEFNEACVDLKHAENFGMKIDTKVKTKICDAPK